MSAFDPPYVLRKSSATGGSSPPTPPPSAPPLVYAEPVMTTDGDYMTMGDGDIVMALVSVVTTRHNEDFTL